jgi:hypothetical protein
MARASKLRLAFMNLNGEISSDEIFGYFDKSIALRTLKNITGQDFGYDVGAWRKWINEHRPNELPREEKEVDHFLKNQDLYEEIHKENPLEILYKDYLESNLNFSIAERLVTVLKKNRLELESYALKTYLDKGSGSKISVSEWGNRSCIISLNLPDNAEPGDLWFDPVELNLAILIPSPQDISHHLTSWVSTHPVYVWQYRAFLRLIKVGKKLDVFPSPDDYLTLKRIHNQPSLKYVSNLYQDEAIAYSSWMRKSLCGQSNLKAMQEYLSLKELNSILPSTMKLWASGEFQEDYRIAVGLKSLNKNPSIDYDDIVEENYDELESQSDRMLYEEWDDRGSIGMLTVVPVFIGLGQKDTTATFHYQLLNRSPRSVLSLVD